MPREGKMGGVFFVKTRAPSRIPLMISRSYQPEGQRTNQSIMESERPSTSLCYNRRRDLKMIGPATHPMVGTPTSSPHTHTKRLSVPITYMSISHTGKFVIYNISTSLKLLTLRNNFFLFSLNLVHVHSTYQSNFCFFMNTQFCEIQIWYYAYKIAE